MNAKAIIETDETDDYYSLRKANDLDIFEVMKAGILDLRRQYNPIFKKAGFVLDDTSQAREGCLLNQLVYDDAEFTACVHDPYRGRAIPVATVNTYIHGKTISIRFGNMNMRDTHGTRRIVTFADAGHFEGQRWFRGDESHTTVPPEDCEKIENDGMRVFAAMAYYGNVLEIILKKITP